MTVFYIMLLAPPCTPPPPPLSLSLSMKELEHKLKQQKHNIQFAEMVQSKLLHCEDVERELRQLREENAALRSHTDNVSLMRYQLQTLQERVERSEDVERKAVRLEVENEALRERREESGKGRGSLGAWYVSSLYVDILYVCLT